MKFLVKPKMSEKTSASCGIQIGKTFASCGIQTGKDCGRQIGKIEICGIQTGKI